jgi:phage gp36-like protein
MFLSALELKSVIYDYQLSEIVEDDLTIVEIAISSAEEEVQSYLVGRYDVQLTFSATGADRNPLIVEIVKDVALWQIVRLSNPDIIYDRVKDRYDRAVEWLDKVASGLISITLPSAQNPDGGDLTPIRYGSLPPQTYDY